MARGPVLTVTLTTDNKKFAEGLKAATGDLEKFGKDVTSRFASFGGGAVAGFGSRLVGDLNALGGKIVGIVSDWFIKGAKIGAGAIAAVVGVSLFKGLNRVLDTEDAQVQLKRMGFSIEEIDRLLKMVDTTFDGTVFANPDGFAAVQQMLGAGMSFDEVQRGLQTMADWAAHANVPLERMQGIFMRIQNRGRVTAEELNSLSEAGIPLSEIAKSLGLSVPQMQKMVSEGKLTADQFFEATSGIEMFAGAAKAAGDTTRGAWSNVWTALAAAGEKFLKPLFGEGGFVVNGLQRMRLAIRNLFPAIEGLGQRFADWLVPAVQKATDWLGGPFIDVMREVRETIDVGVAWVKEYEEEIRKIVDAVVPAVGAISGLAVGIHLLAVGFGLILKASPIGLLLAVATGLIYAWQNSEKFREVVTEAFEKVKGVYEDLRARVEDVLPKIQAWLTGTGDSAMSFKDRVVEAFNGVVAWVQEHLLPLFNELKDLAVNVFGVISEAAVALWETFGESILEYAVVAFTFIQEAIEAFLAFFTGFVQVLNGIIEGDFSKIWEGVKTMLSAVWDWIKALFNFGRGAISAIWSALWAGIKAIVSNQWETIKSIISTGIDAALAFFREMPGRAAIAIGNVGLTLINKGKELLAGLREGVTNGWAVVWLWLQGLPSRAISAIGGVGRTLWNIGRSILDGLWGGMKEKWNEMTGWIGSLAGRIRNLKGPPAYDATILVENGGLVMGGFLSGLKDGWKDVEGFLTGVGGMMPSPNLNFAPAADAPRGNTSNATIIQNFPAGMRPNDVVDAQRRWARRNGPQ